MWNINVYRHIMNNQGQHLLKLDVLPCTKILVSSSKTVMVASQHDMYLIFSLSLFSLLTSVSQSLSLPLFPILCTCQPFTHYYMSVSVLSFYPPSRIASRKNSLSFYISVSRSVSVCLSVIKAELLE